MGFLFNHQLFDSKKKCPVSGHSYCSRAGDSDFCPSLFGEFLQGWETLWICRAWFGSRCSSFGEVWFGVRWEWSHEVLLGSKDWWVEREKQLYHHRKTISRWSIEIRRCLSSIRWFVDDSILVGNLSNVHCRGSSVKALTGSGQKRSWDECHFKAVIMVCEIYAWCQLWFVEKRSDIYEMPYRLIDLWFMKFMAYSHHFTWCQVKGTPRRCSQTRCWSDCW